MAPHTGGITKKIGRPTLLADDERQIVAYLYYDMGWTAERIRDRLFPHVAADSIRAMARSTRGVTKRTGPK